ncbi:uncharacterized protein LOC135107037 isoform X9 [Scylla paramamosain]|uniref:uncharacterized protein LOC135107037 isoform X9 n=1 Tax=Scylla paramamosain TaxID=85552 RepID=UPI003083ED2C
MADLLGSVFFRTQFAVTVVQDRHSLAGGLLPTVQQVKMQLRCSEVRAANSLDDYSEIDFIAGKNNGIIIQGESLPAAVCCLLCYWPLDSTLRVSQEGIQTLSESTPSCLVRLQRLELRCFWQYPAHLSSRLLRVQRRTVRTFEFINSGAEPIRHLHFLTFLLHYYFSA